MSLTTYKPFQSEIYTPITPPAVWTPLEKPINECVVGFASACGVHLKKQIPYKTSGDKTWRVVPKNVRPDELMITHGGYDHTDVNKDINCMWPYQRMQELEDEGFIKYFCDDNAGFMGGGGDVELLRDKTGPEMAELFKKQGADIVLITAG